MTPAPDWTPARWSGPYHVVDGDGRSIESHATAAAADRAARWCNEHEVRNGRDPRYRVQHRREVRP